MKASSRSNIAEEMKETVYAPFYNSLVCQNANIIPVLMNESGKTLDKNLGTHLDLHVPVMQPMVVAKANPDHLRSVIEQCSSGAGWLAGFLCTARALGKVSRTVGNKITPEISITKNFDIARVAQVTRNFIRSESTNNVVSAGIYDTLRPPTDGESRYARGLSTMVAFGTFETGNKFSHAVTSPLSPSQISRRACIGALAGVAQTEVVNIIDRHQAAPGREVDRAITVGGWTNVLLPALQQRGDASGRTPVYADEWLKTQHEVATRHPVFNPGAPRTLGTLADKAAVRALYDAAGADLHTRIKASDVEFTHIDQKRSVITINTDDTIDSLAQELFHREVKLQPAHEAAFKEAARLVQSADASSVQAGRELYISTRVLQEQNARILQNEFAKKLNMNLEPVKTDALSIDSEYSFVFEREALRFIKSGGQFRPEIDHARMLLVNECSNHRPEPRQESYKSIEVPQKKWKLEWSESVRNKLANRDIDVPQLKFACRHWLHVNGGKSLIEERTQHETRDAARYGEGQSAQTIWFVAPANEGGSRTLKVVAMLYDDLNTLEFKSAYDAKYADQRDYSRWALKQNIAHGKNPSGSAKVFLPPPLEHK